MRATAQLRLLLIPALVGVLAAIAPVGSADAATPTATSTPAVDAELHTASGPLEEAQAGATIGHPDPRRHTHRRVIRRRVRRVSPPPRERPVAVRRVVDPRLGAYLTVGGVGNVFLGGGDDLQRVYDGGGGFGLGFGFRLTSRVAVELAWIAAFQQTQALSADGPPPQNAMLQAFSVDARIYLAPQYLAVEPYAQIGLGAYVLSEDFRRELTGFGLDAGLGLDLRFSEWLAVGARVLWRGFYVDNADDTYDAIPTESGFLNTLTFEANLQFRIF